MRAKEIEPSKPRNFVAKNAKMGGAGAHKDKKKAQKQGDVKHKNKEIAEGDVELNPGEETHYFRVRHQTKRDIELEMPPKAWDAVGPAYATFDEAQAAFKSLQAKYPNEKFTYTQHPRISHMGGVAKRVFPENVSESVSYGTMPADALRTLLHVYQDNSEGVEQYRDSEGAKRIANALNDAAKELGVSRELKSLYNAASHSAHMDFDTNPGDFKNWFTYVGDLLQGLYKVHQEKGSYDNDEPDTHPDKEKMSERFRDPEDWDEGNTEPANNFAVYINGKKWKVFKGRGYYADDFRERQHYQQLKAWADKKSAATGKKWSVHTTGEPATE
jgi:hypothetical protein